MESTSGAATTDLTPSGTQTQVITIDNVPEPPQDAPTVRLNLRRTSTEKKVSWNENTVDNENMGKKKSKCCCIYRKPLEFGESSSEGDEDECDHCFGHVERKKKNHRLHGDSGGGDDDHDDDDGDGDGAGPSGGCDDDNGKGASS